jgi:hypothetical protein
MIEWLSVPDTNLEVCEDGRVRRDGVELTPYVNSAGYRAIWANDKLCLLHRLIAEAFIPNPECKPCVDHIDRNKLNNAITNLRWATRSENSRNKESTGLLPKGVCANATRKRFRSFIRHEGKQLYLGTFDTPELAAQAYAAKAIELFGEFSGL